MKKNKTITFSEKYKISGDFDFEDIELERDNKKFVDPYLIYITNDNMSRGCANSVIDFFEELLQFAKKNNKKDGYKFVEYLQENNEVRLGYSKDKPKGKGFGRDKGKELFDILINSKAVATGLVSDIFDASMMINNVDRDKISDFTINLILEKLITYTQNQCRRHNVPMSKVKLKRPVWSSQTKQWNDKSEFELPIHKNLPIILVPKNYVRNRLIYSYQRFYENEMMPYYCQQAMNDPSSGLVKILKRGRVRPLKNKIRKKYPCTKPNVLKFIEDHPEKYVDYKYRQLNFIDQNNITVK